MADRVRRSVRVTFPDARVVEGGAPDLPIGARRDARERAICATRVIFGWGPSPLRPPLRRGAQSIRDGRIVSYPSRSYMTASDVPPGWYPDPSRRHSLRAWDGSAWVEYARDGEDIVRDPLPRWYSPPPAPGTNEAGCAGCLTSVMFFVLGLAIIASTMQTFNTGEPFSSGQKVSLVLAAISLALAPLAGVVVMTIVSRRYPKSRQSGK
jgi:hypothetical protein